MICCEPYPRFGSRTYGPVIYASGAGKGLALCCMVSVNQSAGGNVYLALAKAARGLRNLMITYER